MSPLSDPKRNSPEGNSTIELNFEDGKPLFCVFKFVQQSDCANSTEVAKNKAVVKKLFMMLEFVES